MSCVCLQSLRSLLASLLPLAPLANLRLPPAVETLNAHLASRAAAASGMAFNARLALSLPPLPLSLNLVEQISATATATEQLRAAVGFNPAARGGTSSLSLAVSSLNINLAALLAQLLPLLPLLPAITRLSMTMSMVASCAPAWG
ncbi:MAG: hypothetical protein AB7I01_16080 [Gammaproteobacteria bacterium]